VKLPAVIAVAVVLFLGSAARAEPLVYEGETGPGRGKHLVFISGDHEYRSEESLPALARILARHHGFKCTVLFNVDPKSGEIVPGNNNLPGTQALNSADLMVIFTRFQNLPPDQMQPIVDYLDRGGPVIGLRTATHAFKIPADSEFARFSYEYPGQEYEKGFGRQVLGESWAGHYGKNHVMSTRLDLVPSASAHPILRGVSNVWVQAGGYWTDPVPGIEVLAMAQPLNGMTIDSPPAPDKMPCPGAWTRTYRSRSGKEGRVFTTTYGASEDLLNEGFRRMLVNACFWAAGMDESIMPGLDVSVVGPYQPATFSFNGHRRGVKPLDLSGWETPIMPSGKPTSDEQP
jgi:type 1 glutamine amidotransferase